MTDAAPVNVDVIVVGGGAAGLSAALVLAQAFRSVVIIDEAHPANGRADVIRGHLGLDGISPAAYRAAACADVEAAGGVLVSAAAHRAQHRPGDARIAVDADGRRWAGRALVLAPGVRYVLPAVPGLAELWGTAVVQCPYCYAWGARRAARTAVLDTGPATLRLAALLTQWSREVVLVGAGDAVPALPRMRPIPAQATAIAQTGPSGIEIGLSDGGVLPADVCFVDPPVVARLGLLDSLLPEAMCAPVPLDPTGRTPVDRVWVTGTAAVPTHKVITSAAHGAAAAQAINAMLVEEDLTRATPRPLTRSTP